MQHSGMVSQPKMLEQTVKPSLHVEVRIRPPARGWPAMNSVREEVARWLPEAFRYLSIGQDVTSYESLEHASVIDAINIVDYSGHNSDEFFDLRNTQVNVQAYILHEDIDSSQPEITCEQPGSDEQNEHSRVVRTISLPNAAFSSIWSSLHFENQIPEKLLHYTTRRMAMVRKASEHQSFLDWRRLMLLHGPPGSGKTSLCRALAQKLAIRLGNDFSDAKLLEVNAHALHSKWFGESGKIIGKLFQHCHDLAEDVDTLVCVLIDEVETLAGSREKAEASNDVGDALRATNSLLTGLDALRCRTNVMVFCTSNLIATVDSAFLDRVGINQFIGNPTTGAAYEILRSCLNEMVRCNILMYAEESFERTEMDSEYDSANPEVFPRLGTVQLNLCVRPDAPGSRLLAIAEKCSGMSGRALADLPCSALATYTDHDPCTTDEGLRALSLAVEKGIGQRSGYCI